MVMFWLTDQRDLHSTKPAKLDQVTSMIRPRVVIGPTLQGGMNRDQVRCHFIQWIWETQTVIQKKITHSFGLAKVGFDLLFQIQKISLNYETSFWVITCGVNM